MNPRERHARRRGGRWSGGDARLLCHLAAAAGLAFWIAGCAAPPATAPGTPLPSPAYRSLAQIGPAFASMEAEDARQARSPLAATKSWPPPPGLDPALSVITAPSAEALARAKEPLDPVVDRLVTLARPPVPGRAGQEASEADKLEALRSYTSGREKLLASGASSAIEDLRRATRLDPAAPEPWRALGEAQMQMGAREEGLRSFEEALERGPGDARVLETLGRAALERSDFKAAATYLALAMRAEAAPDDPGLVQVVCVQLSRALGAEGYAAASREALARAIEESQRSASVSRYQQELAAVFRRRAELWRDAGDAALRLGLYQEAIDSYDRAAEVPGLDGVPLGPRRAFAAVRAGRPAHAANFVFRKVVNSGGRVDSTDLAMIRYLAPAGNLGRDMAAGADQLRGAVSAAGESTPTIAAGLRRAQAAASRPSEARAVLVAAIADSPANSELARDLILSEPDAPSAARTAAALARAHPFQAGVYASALAARPEEPGVLVRAAEAVAGLDGGAVLASGVERRLGDPARAAAFVDAVPVGSRAGPTAASASAALNASLGRWQEARSALARLEGVKGPDAARARAMALAALGRPGDALAEVAVLVDPPAPDGQRIEDLLLAADIAAAAGRAGDAERYLRRVMAADTADERVYARLLELFNYDGLAPDATKATQAVRDARLNAPDARVLRWVRAQEVARRALLPQAERLLIPLAEEDADDPRPVELLLVVWERLAAQDKEGTCARAIEWLDVRLERRPNHPALIVARARVLAISDSPSSAAAYLRASLDRAWSSPVSRALERVLRESLANPDEADRLTMARLSSAPRTTESSLELAEALLRQGDASAAADAVLSGGGPGDALTAEQGRRLTGLAAGVAARAIGAQDPAMAGPAVRLLDAAAARGARLTKELHSARIGLMAMEDRPDNAAILSAAALAGREFPAESTAFYVLAAQVFEKRERMDLLLAYLPEAADRIVPLPIEYVEFWFQRIGEGGGVADARRLISRVESSGQLELLFDRVRSEALRGPPPKPRGEIAYVLASIASTSGREREAADFCELALELDPGHVWAANDLGYALADRGEHLDRAEALIESAYARVPGSASITDSLGWVRYKKGELYDTPAADPAGAPKLGALSLLRIAASSPEGRGNQVLIDHQADALWLAGQKDEAIRLWQDAERNVTEFLTRLGPRASEPGVRPFVQLQRAVRAKLAAAREGGAVEVASHAPVVPAPPEPPAQGPANNAGANENPGER